MGLFSEAEINAIETALYSAQMDKVTLQTFLKGYQLAYKEMALYKHRYDEEALDKKPHKYDWKALHLKAGLFEELVSSGSAYQKDRQYLIDTAQKVGYCFGIVVFTMRFFPEQVLSPGDFSKFHYSMSSCIIEKHPVLLPFFKKRFCRWLEDTRSQVDAHSEYMGAYQKFFNLAKSL